MSHQELEKRLWQAADQLRANSKLKASEYSAPVLGLIFLRYADLKFQAVADKVKKEIGASSRRKISKTPFQAAGVLFLDDKAQYEYLLNLPEGTNVGEAINNAMELIEKDNEELRGVLPRDYEGFEPEVLTSLLKNFNAMLTTPSGDLFGKTYEYFIGEFARAEGSKGGEFFTPESLVKLIVEVIEPYHGRIYDPACGSGGMFVQSAHFIEEHKKNPSKELSIYGQEKTDDTRKLCKMNLAVHGLSGEIKSGNTYYEDIHESLDKFDFVMANPPFNVNGIQKDRLKTDARFPFGMPSTDNANYLWIQLFYSALNKTGKAGFVMANSAADARGSEMEIRKKLLQAKAVDVMISIGSNFFYTVTLPCTLWFFDKAKKGTKREDTVLFIDARDIFHQVDRAHRDFEPEQIEFIANIVRLYRGEKPEFTKGSDKDFKATFPKLKYQDIAGRCKAATLNEIEAQGWSLNPGRYVGVTTIDSLYNDDFEYKIGRLSSEFFTLNKTAEDLSKIIQKNLQTIVKVNA
jgi:type I restriction enzyme M protein